MREKNEISVLVSLNNRKTCWITWFGRTQIQKRKKNTNEHTNFRIWKKLESIEIYANILKLDRYDAIRCDSMLMMESDEKKKYCSQRISRNNTNDNDDDKTTRHTKKWRFNHSTSQPNLSAWEKNEKRRKQNKFERNFPHQFHIPR